MPLRGQAATEYLVILGAVLLIAAVTVSVMALSIDTSSAQVKESQAYWRSTYPFIIPSAKAVGTGLVLTVQNAADEPLWLTGITIGGTRLLLYDYSGDVFGASRCPSGLDSCSIQIDIGQSATVVARGAPECLRTSFSYNDVVLYYSNLDLSGLLQKGDKFLAGYCSQKVAGASFSPPTPANDSWFSAGSNITINSTIQGMALSSLNFTWNGSDTRVYDDSLVLALNFDDQAAVGDTAGKVVDVSQYGNNGTIYGNTLLLLHMDEDGNKTFDESRYANNGTVYGNTLLLLHFDESAGSTAYDDSAYRNNGTCYNMNGGSGVTNCNWTGGKSGGAIGFDGANDYVSIGTGTNPLAAITVSAWINPAVVDTYNQASVLTKFASDKYQWKIGLTNTGVARFDVYSDQTTSTSPIRYGAALVAGQWYHIVGTFDGSVANVYLNGAAGTPQPFVHTLQNTDAPIYVGYESVNTRYFNGSIDEVAIYNRSLSASEVLDLYSAGRAKFAERVFGKSGTGLQFDGQLNSSFVSFPLASSLYTSSATTIIAWVKTNSTSRQTITQKGNNCHVHPDKWFLINAYTGSYPRRLAYRVPASPFQAVSSYIPTLLDGNFHQVAVVAVNDAPVQFYFDGANVTDPASVAYNVSPNANNWPLMVGAAKIYCNSEARDYTFAGTIDEVAIFNRSLNATEIAQHYAAGKAKHADWEPSGKWNSAMRFDGVDDYVGISNSANLNFSTPEVTVLFWAKATYSGMAYLMRKGSVTFALPGPGFGFAYAANPQKLYALVGDGSNYLPIYTDLGSFGWTQLGIKRKADGSVYLIVNGVESLQGSLSGGIMSNSALEIGRADYPTYTSFNGSIDEVRVWNRSLSADEIRQNYYSSLNKYDANKWIFTATEPFVPAGTHSFSLIATGANGTTDFTANRTVRVS